MFNKAFANKTTKKEKMNSGCCDLNETDAIEDFSESLWMQWLKELTIMADIYRFAVRANLHQGCVAYGRESGTQIGRAHV